MQDLLNTDRNSETLKTKISSSFSIQTQTLFIRYYHENVLLNVMILCNLLYCYSVTRLQCYNEASRQAFPPKLKQKQY